MFIQIAPAHLEGVPVDEEGSAGEGVIAGESAFELFRRWRAAVEKVATSVLKITLLFWSKTT